MGLPTSGLPAQTCGSWESWLTPNATLRLDRVCKSLPVSPVLSASFSNWLPLQSELSFLPNFLFGRRELAPSKETGSLVSDVLIFQRNVLAPQKNPPSLFLPQALGGPSGWVLPTSPITIQDKQKGAGMGSVMAQISLSIYTDTVFSSVLEAHSLNDAKRSKFASIITIL